jgi:hypothetical protein
MTAILNGPIGGRCWAQMPRLNIHDVARLPAISIGDQIYLVIGILRDTARNRPSSRNRRYPRAYRCAIPLESASMGVVGGIVGASIGVLVVVVVSALQVWSPVLDPAVPLLAPAVGGGSACCRVFIHALRSWNRRKRSDTDADTRVVAGQLRCSPKSSVADGRSSTVT